ncbi:hypothetical protein H6F77_16135 [Microcoleus sp. FACHB-831]|uniref:hypothetical protein n=1 Tax=Microcoleus sp. FACHB-831 TaxID=2692827 RepID=UPI001686D4DB|nr:hypothetical protein [Microcoleus sp. FACHB-831]MBD1922599.1 hypothetical protein [Microcoleus sp. FACHB-831]
MLEKHSFYIPSHSFKKPQFFSRVPVSTLMFGASAALFLDMIVTAKFASFFGFIIALLGTAIIGFQPESIKFINWTQRWGNQYKISLPLLVFCAVVTVFFLDYTSAPAQAQFFNQAESWLRSSFPINGGAGGGGTDIYNLVFNTLRAIFVLYLAVSLVRVIAAARNDEDWQTLARTPLIILITVTLGDILAALITGGGTGGGANP